MGHHTALLFDLDETLVQPPNDEGRRLQEAFKKADVEPFFDHDDFARWVPKVEGENALDLRKKCFRGIAQEKGRSLSAAEDVAAAYNQPEGAEFDPIEYAPEVVEILKKKGYRIGLVTNGAEARQREKLRQLDLESSFDAMYFGTLESGLKPDSKPFQIVLEELNAKPENTVKIGDLIEVDIEPAKQMGLTTVWFPNGNARKSPIPDITIKNLSELINEPWIGIT